MNKKITLVSALAFLFFVSENLSAQETDQNKSINDSISSNKIKKDTLDNSAVQIQTVEITGRKERGYKNTRTFSAT